MDAGRCERCFVIRWNISRNRLLVYINRQSFRFWKNSNRNYQCSRKIRCKISCKTFCIGITYLNQSFPFEGVVIALFFILLSIGFIYPNSVSRALSPFKELSGSASTMNGSFMMAMSAIITAVVGSLGMLMPFVMFAVMTCASILAILIFSIARNSK
ncbi:MAG: bicyclomycin/multidrug efflux system [Bacteroidetes bacterium ADurb.BinA245]|nr:MAG: bicyclomycin/multidrug efflux system [Bacteroidetes bacterium ADurb.BinA245]